MRSSNVVEMGVQFVSISLIREPGYRLSSFRMKKVKSALLSRKYLSIAVVFKYRQTRLRTLTSFGSKNDRIPVL